MNQTQVRPASLEPLEGLDAAVWLAATEQSAAADGPGAEVGECALPLVGVLDSLRRARPRRQRLVDPSARLDRGFLVGADDEVAGMQQSSLPAARVEVEHPPRLLLEVGIAGEDPGAVAPGLDRVLGQPASNRRSRRLAEATLDDEPVQLSPGEARERDALRSRQPAGDRFHLGDLFRGENGAGGPHACDPRAPANARRGSACASARPRLALSRGAPRSRRSSGPQPRRGSSSPAVLPCADGCSRQPDARAQPAPRCSRRSRTGSCLAWRRRFASRDVSPSSPTELRAGSTKRGPPLASRWGKERR